MTTQKDIEKIIREELYINDDYDSATLDPESIETAANIIFQIIEDKDREIASLRYALEGYRHNLSCLKADIGELVLKIYPHSLEEIMNPAKQ